MPKETSTNYENRQMLSSCPVTYTISLIGGRWKPIILWSLVHGTRRFSELKRGIPQITEKMLTQQLRELEADGLVNRQVYQEVPPRVEYSLTARGQSLQPVLQSMLSWGLAHMKADGPLPLPGSPPQNSFFFEAGKMIFAVV
jgi:DNA-binding HxlR family transcriptional regulator